MKITYQETYEKGTYCKNQDIVNQFMNRPEKVMVLNLTIGRGDDCDYITMGCAQSTWKRSINRAGLSDKLDVFTNIKEYKLYIIKKGSDSNELKTDKSIDTDTFVPSKHNCCEIASGNSY